MFDIQPLLQPVSTDAPAGANLDESAAFAEYERALQGKPERQIGATIVAAEPPEWTSVIQRASTLLKTSKDLRVAVPLVRALLATQHFSGLASGLALVGQMVAEYWPVLHPRLEEEDKDATARISAMTGLTHREMLQAIRSARIVPGKGEPITLRTLEAAVAHGANGTSSHGATPTETLESVSLADLEEAAEWVNRCDSGARDLELSWSSHVDAGGPDFTELRRLLAQANKMMKSRLAERQPVTGADAGSPAIARDEGPAPPRLASPGELRTREDVVSALDRICAYYARHEPSSPVPLLLERCKRLVAMSFVDIVKDMMPDGLSTIEKIAGKQHE